MSTIKDRSGTDLTEAEDIKKRGQEYTKELYFFFLVNLFLFLLGSRGWDGEYL